MLRLDEIPQVKYSHDASMHQQIVLESKPLEKTAIAKTFQNVLSTAAVNSGKFIDLLKSGIVYL